MKEILVRIGLGILFCLIMLIGIILIPVWLPLAILYFFGSIIREE